MTTLQTLILIHSHAILLASHPVWLFTLAHPASSHGAKRVTLLDIYQPMPSDFNRTIIISYIEFPIQYSNYLNTTLISVT
jgi:hypothetical protein